MRWGRQNQEIVSRQNQFVILSADFVIAGFVIRGFVSTYFTVILPGFQMLFVITGLVMARFITAGCHCMFENYFF